MLKSLLGNPAVQYLIGRTIGIYLMLVGATTRWKRVNQAAAEPYWSGQGRLVVCVWHGRFPQAHKLWKFGPGATKAVFLVSRSREGAIAAHAAQTLGVAVVRGSAAKGAQDKGGFEAGRDLVRQVAAGRIVGMTPDGPRGPRMRARLGPVNLARLAQAPLLPLAWSTRWRIVFGSWDRFILPLPFGPGALVWGDPIPPPGRGADAAAMEACRLKLEQELNRISAEADRLAGVPVIEPAPAPASAAPEAEEAALAP